MFTALAIFLKGTALLYLEDEVGGSAGLLRDVIMALLEFRPTSRGVARNLIWVGVNGSRRQNNHIKN